MVKRPDAVSGGVENIPTQQVEAETKDEVKVCLTDRRDVGFRKSLPCTPVGPGLHAPHGHSAEQVGDIPGRRRRGSPDGRSRYVVQAVWQKVAYWSPTRPGGGQDDEAGDRDAAFDEQLDALHLPGG